jgi:hypothetical protein
MPHEVRRIQISLPAPRRAEPSATRHQLARPHLRPILPLALLLLMMGGTSPAGTVVLGQDSPSTVNVELVLDASGSMNERIGRETRMQIAKRVLTQVVDAIPERPGINVGFRLYGHRGDNTRAGDVTTIRAGTEP